MPAAPSPRPRPLAARITALMRPLASRVTALLLLGAARARAQCTGVSHQDFDQGNVGVQWPATSAADCCTQCIAAGPTVCWVAVFVDVPPTGSTCWPKTQDMSTRPYESQDRGITALWPAGRTPSTTPPPGCKVDTTVPYAFICVGQELVLRPCNFSAAAQHFWTGAGGGNIRHADMSTSPGFGDSVQAFYGNNEGFAPRFALQTNDAQGGVAGHPDQSWWERDRGTNDPDTDETIVTNVNTTGMNISAINVSEIEGCRQWALEGEQMSDGAYLVPAPCVAGAPNRSWGFDRAGFVGCISALFDEKNSSSLSGLCVAVESFRAADGPYVVDDSPGLGIRYDGVSVTAGEGSTRLLLDYAPQPQGEVLDYLFLPGYALKADVLKIEIGGDGNVLQGSSPSHQHFAGEIPNVARGSQSWLARQARLRNPAIKIYALPWAFPGFMRQGLTTRSPFTNPAAAAAYVIAFLQGMVAQGTPVDFVGVYSDNWDPVLSVNYVLQLKPALAAAGFGAVLIVCDDALNGWPCAEQATNSAHPHYTPALLQVVDIFSSHGDPPAALITALAGKVLWNTHLSDAGQSDLLGATYLSWQLSELAVNGGCSLGSVWAALCSTYDGMPEYNQGLVRADQPWSGHYYVTPALWAVAHTSAFNTPGSFQFKAQSGVGVLAGSGSYVTRMRADSSAFSIVVSKGLNHDVARNRILHPEVVTFALRGAPLRLAQAAGVAFGVPNGVLHVFASNFGGSPTGNASFAKYVGTTPLYQVGGAGDWLVSVFAGLDSITTLSSLDTLFPKTRPVTAPAPPGPFPREFSSDWTTGERQAGQPAPFVVDISGSFEIVTSPVAGLRQLAADVPLTRFQTDVAPHAILGDQLWADIAFTARFWLPSATDTVMIAVRASGFGDGLNNHVSGMDELPGLWLELAASGRWAVTDRLNAAAKTLAAGTLAVPPSIQRWHALQLVARGARLVARLDDILISSVSTATSSAPKSGFVAIGARAYGHKPVFGGVTISATGSSCSAFPREGHLLVEEACSPGAPGQSWSFAPLPGSTEGVGQFVSVANASLCLAANATADEGFMGDAGARGTFVALCNAAEIRQQFRVEGTIVDGTVRMGPIQGPDRLTLNVRGDSTTSNSAICAYPWQGNSNAIWSLVSGLIWNPLYKRVPALRPRADIASGPPNRLSFLSFPALAAPVLLHATCRRNGPAFLACRALCTLDLP